MRRKKLAARISAMILAVTMVFTQTAPTMAAEIDAIPDAAIEVIEQVPDGNAEMNEANDPGRVEDVMGEEIEVIELMDGAAEDAQAEAEAQAHMSKPGKVTNVRFDTEVGSTGVTDQQIVSWNADQAADGYEISISDGTYEYGTGGRFISTEYDSEKGQYTGAWDGEWTYVEVDKGKGDYILKDYTEYYVGRGKGSYDHYVFVGAGKGYYDLVQDENGVYYFDDVGYDENWNYKGSYQYSSLLVEVGANKGQYTKLSGCYRSAYSDDVVRYDLVDFDGDGIVDRFVEAENGSWAQEKEPQYVYVGSRKGNFVERYYYKLNEEGKGYYNYEHTYKEVYGRSSTSYTLNTANLRSLVASTIAADGKAAPVYGDDKRRVKIAENKEYTLKIRAYNSEYVDKLDDDTKLYGEWSDPITFKYETTYALETLTGIELVEQENGDNYLHWNSGNNTYVEMEIKDAEGKEYFTYATVGYDADGKAFLDGDYVEEDDEYFYLGSRNTASLYELIQKDENGADIPAYVQEVERVNADQSTSVVTAFEAGKTYTIRLRGVVEISDKYSDNKENLQYTEWSEPITYICKEKEKPEELGELEFHDNGYNPYITWRNDPRRAEGYEFELSDTVGNKYGYTTNRVYDSTTNSYKNAYELGLITRNSRYFYLDSYKVWTLDENGYPVTKKVGEGENQKEIVGGQPGQTYTVKVRAYNLTRDGQVKQYTEWKSITVTVPTAPAPEKVTGVRVSGSYAEWDEDKNENLYSTSYEVEVKDAEGNIYYGGYDSKVDPTTSAVSYTYNYYKTSGTSAYLADLHRYTMVDEKPAYVIHPETGNAITAFEQGKTYTVAVRAVRTLDGATEPSYGPWSDPVTYTVPVNTVSEGINAKPETVTGLWIQTEPEKNGKLLYGPVMKWNNIENIDHYEIEIKDSKGNDYTLYPTRINNKYDINNYYYECGKTNSVWMNSLSGLCSYVIAEGKAIDTLKGDDGKALATFEVGETYTIRIRAVNRYREYNVAEKKWNNYVTNVGDWSEAVTYTNGSKETPVTELKLSSADDDYYYFTYKTEKVPGSTIYYQVATDDKFNSASLVQDWSSYSSYSNDSFKLRISKTESYLKPAKTYYVRVANTTWNLQYYGGIEKAEYEKVLAASAVTSFTTDAKKPLKAINNLRIYSEDEYGYQLRFDAVLEKGDTYELQINANPATQNWATIGDCTTYLSKSYLNEGKNYVRVITYGYEENELTGYNDKIYGTPSNFLEIVKETATTSSIGTLKMVEETSSAYTFAYTGTIRKDEDVNVWISDSKNFETNEDGVETKRYTYGYDANKKFTISKSNLTPGKTYYFKARVYNSKAKTTDGKYSAFSGTVKVKAVMPKAYVWKSVVTKNSIQITMNGNHNTTWLTGYEFQRRGVNAETGKEEWQDLGKTTTDTYTDQKLKADTVYSYRIRPYYFNSETKKVTNGEWVFFEAMTGWEGALNLKALAGSKDSVKLSWKTVKGAEGYEVYRLVANSSTSQTSVDAESGYYVNGNSYASYQLIATLGEKKTGYKDSGLTTNMDYTYLVKAYKTVDGKKVFIQEYASVSLGFELDVISAVQDKNGKVKLTWNPVYSAKGYLVEKYDPATGVWSTYKDIKKAKTQSLTLPKTTKDEGVTYRVRAYNGKKYTNTYKITVYPLLKAPTDVKAKVSASSITISWKAVAGADFYRVYRTTNPESVYYQDTNTYAYSGGTEVGRWVKDDSTISGYRKCDLDEMNVTSVTDKKITYSYNGTDNNTLYAGPETGVQYYYYVIAYKNNVTYQYVNEFEEYEVDDYTYHSGASKAAAAKLGGEAPKSNALKKLTSTKTSVKLTYSVSAKADGYELERSMNKKKDYEVVKDITTNDPTAATLTYVDTKSKTNPLRMGTTYYYRMRAYKYDDVGNKVYSKYSAVKSVKTKGSEVAAPAKPQITKAVSKSQNVTLTYKASSKVKGYEIERSTKKNAGFAVISDVKKFSASAKTLTFTDKNSKTNPLVKGKTYYYRIRAYRIDSTGGKVYSGYSNVIAVKVQ